ncbi:MAG: radical SAM protein [Oscillospiraceae bacterium]|nr:radical SAM protein [Oscillospiraceae bacterium]
MLTYEFCTLCPRRCGVNRTRGELGFCRMPAHILAARAAPHYWEEPVISGNFGSGAVFFSGCTLGCRFCQNDSISHGGLGREVSSPHLREIFLRLIDEGVETLNLVTGTQFLPSILPALTPKLSVPVVWNSGGYETLETLRALEGYVDVYLPDFKYSDSALARRLSGAEDYPEVAAAAIREMYRQTGPAVTKDGILQRGVLIRHLILPGCVDNSLGVLDWISDAFPRRDVLVSLMRQYMPMGPAAQEAPFDRPITDTEYDAVLSYLYFLGLENGFTQEASAADPQYVPTFNFEGI